MSAQALIDEPLQTRGDTDQDQVMLTLAMLSYRAYDDLLPGHLAVRHLRQVIDEGLQTLGPVAGDWTLVWGPASYQAPFTVFDESVMYVVRSVSPPTRYAVVVRGTNPVAAFDWLFGDLWAGVLTPWPFASQAGDGAAAVSMSTALGLSVLSHLRAPTPDSPGLSALWELADGRIGDPVRGATRAVVRPVSGLMSGSLERLRFDLRADLRRLRHRREELIGAAPEEKVAGYLALRFSEPAQRILNVLSGPRRILGDEPHRAFLRLLEGNLRLRMRLAPGPTLAEFLAGELSGPGDPVTVTVTGHSKGGAQAPALALALAQCQGGQAPAGWRWDPEHRARVECWSFAGPTPGNRAWAEMADRVLGDRCHRIYNRLDLVPQAWSVRPEHPGDADTFIERAPDLYGAGVHRIPGLDRLAQGIAADVGHLEYTHLQAGARMLPGEVDPDKTLFLEQVTYQHMEAYLEMMGLGDTMDVDTFFAVRA